MGLGLEVQVQGPGQGYWRDSRACFGRSCRLLLLLPLLLLLTPSYTKLLHGVGQGGNALRSMK